MKANNLLLGLVLSIFLLSFYPVLATDFSVSPPIYGEINLSKETYLPEIIKIFNHENTTIIAEISSTNPDKIFISHSSPELLPYQNTSVYITINSQNKEQFINEEIEITVNTVTKKIPIKVFVLAIASEITEEEVLSASPPYSNDVMKGFTGQETITITNVGASDIELKKIYINGGLLTLAGYKPVDVKNFVGCTLTPGDTKTIIVDIDTSGPEINYGSYKTIISLQYAKNKLLEMPFTVNVIQSAQPEVSSNQTMILKISPEVPEVGSLGWIKVEDEEGKKVPATINVIHYDCSGNKIEEFEYEEPFNWKSGNYSITSTAENYAAAAKTISLAELATKITITPASPTTDDTIKIKYLTENDILIDGEININNETYTGEVSIKLNEGTYSITANALGYVEASKDITVIQILKVIIPKSVLDKDEEQVIKFNKEVSWELRTEGRTIDYGKGDKFQFKESEPGIYDIYVDNKNYGSLTVESKAPDMAFIYDYWWVIVLVVGFIVIYKYVKLPKGSRRKPSLGYGTPIRRPVQDIEDKE